MGITRYVTEQEYLELKEKHDALAAQVEAIRNVNRYLELNQTIDDGYEPFQINVLHKSSGGKIIKSEELDLILNRTPAACLAQVRAEAVEEFAKDVLAEIGAATTYQHVIDILNMGIRK